MHLTLNLLSVALFFKAASSSSVLLPRDPRGAGGGGGGGGSRGRGGSSGGGTVVVVDTTPHIGSTFSSGAGRGGSGDTGRSAISYYNVGETTREANFFSGGGGRRLTLPDTSVFKGREMGGGVRADVPGTRSYGSGYPYSSRDVRTCGVMGQPFPFGFFPIYWAGHGRSDEYGSTRAVQYERPGGAQIMAQLTPVTGSSWSNNTLGQGNKTLWMIGDGQSVNTLLSILVDPHETYTYGCNVAKLSTKSFNSSNPLTPVHFDNVIQWYRSSSFALAYTGYNNTYALPPLNETVGLGWNDSISLPSTLVSSPFLECINTTIIAALPIIDQDPPYYLNAGQIVGFVVGSIVAVLFGSLCFLLCRNMTRLKKIASQARDSKRQTPLLASDINDAGAQKATSGTEPASGFQEPLLQVDETVLGPENQSLLSFPFPSLVLRESGLLEVSRPGVHARRGSADSERTLVMETARANGHGHFSIVTE